MKSCVFLIVRLNSTRLTKKALRKISGFSMIQILINRLSENGKRKLVVCTTDTKSDDELVRHIKKLNVKIFRGNSQDVLKRISSAAEKYEEKFFVLVDGDDVFCDPKLIDKTFNELKKDNHDLIEWKDLSFGVSPIGIRSKNLKKLVETKKNENTDTGGGEIMRKSGLFKIKEMRDKNKKLHRPEIRLSVDYKNDLKLIRKIFKNLKKEFSLLDIIKILDKNPDWIKINENEKKMYMEHFLKKTVI